MRNRSTSSAMAVAVATNASRRRLNPKQRGRADSALIADQSAKDSRQCAGDPCCALAESHARRESSDSGNSREHQQDAQHVSEDRAAHPVYAGARPPGRRLRWLRRRSSSTRRSTCWRITTKRNAVPMKCGMETTATASLVPIQAASSGVRMLPMPKPEMAAMAPATIPASVSRREWFMDEADPLVSVPANGLHSYPVFHSFPTYR